jgi:hypothetical protein
VELALPEDPIAAALELLAEHADHLSALDAQVAGFSGTAGRVGELAALARLMDERITALGARLDDAGPDGQPGDGSYEPAPPRRWWRLAGKDREQALAALRAWVEQVYRPGYGQVAATLGPCWDQHVLCLYALDILAELWSVLYLAESRSAGLLSMQAEFQARILPALTSQMAAETSRCRHGRDQNFPPPAGPARRTP